MDQFASEWKRVAEGDFFACHVTAPDLHPYDEKSKMAGFVTPIETGKRPECSGAALAIQRELDLATSFPSYEAYRVARPSGLSRKAIRSAMRRQKGTLAPPLRTPAKFPMDAIRDPNEEIDATSPAWVFGGESVDALVAHIDAVLGCSCPVCIRHAEVHTAQSIITADGQQAEVDEVLAPLLEAMNNAGIRTTDSCQNLSEAVAQLWPERLPVLASDQSATVNYARTIATGNAFIRLRTNTAAERRFLDALARVEGVTTQQTSEVAQVDFPLTALLRLTELASNSAKEERA